MFIKKWILWRNGVKLHFVAIALLWERHVHLHEACSGCSYIASQRSTAKHAF